MSTDNEPQQGRPPIPEANLIIELHRLDEQLERPLRSTDMDKLGDYSARTYTNRFGSWNNAIEKAGLELHPSQRKPSKNELAEELHRLADDLGHTPRQYEMDEQGVFSPAQCTYQFDSWNDAIEQAGLDPLNGGRPKLSHDELIAELQRLHDELDRVPLVRDMSDHGEYSHLVYYERYESWGGALEEADISTQD